MTKYETVTNEKLWNEIFPANGNQIAPETRRIILCGNGLTQRCNESFSNENTFKKMKEMNTDKEVALILNSNEDVEDILYKVEIAREVTDKLKIKTNLEMLYKKNCQNFYTGNCKNK